PGKERRTGSRTRSERPCGAGDGAQGAAGNVGPRCADGRGARRPARERPAVGSGQGRPGRPRKHELRHPHVAGAALRAAGNRGRGEASAPRVAAARRRRPGRLPQCRQEHARLAPLARAAEDRRLSVHDAAAAPRRRPVQGQPQLRALRRDGAGAGRRAHACTARARRAPRKGAETAHVSRRRPPRPWPGPVRPVDPADLVGPRGLTEEVLREDCEEGPESGPAQFFWSLLTAERRTRIQSVVDARLQSVTVVLDRLLDPHNTAAILRTAEGLGLARAHVVAHAAGDAVAHRRVTQDAHKWMDVDAHPDGAAAAEKLCADGYEVWAGHLDAGGRPYTALPPERPVAVL